MMLIVSEQIDFYAKNLFDSAISKHPIRLNFIAKKYQHYAG